MVLRTLFYSVLLLLAIQSNGQPNLKQGANRHNNFRTFWKDFKNAVATGDKNSVASMVRFPFKDERDLGQGIGRGANNLTCKNNAEFLQKYDKLFPPVAKQAIVGDKYNPCHEDDGDPDDTTIQVIPNCFEVFVDGNMALQFSKANGIYVLSSIPYRE